MNEITVQNEDSMGIDPAILPKLTSYEDFSSYYIQLSQLGDSVSWVKADLMLEMQKKLGANSLVKLSQELHQPASTISTYIRAAKAFPIDKRNSTQSFSMHLLASYADSYDDTKKVFWGEERFHWLEKAADNNWPTRKLQAEIQDKKPQKHKQTIKPCVKCGVSEKKTKNYILYAPGVMMRSKKFAMDEECFTKLLTWIYGSTTTDTKNALPQQDNSGNK